MKLGAKEQPSGSQQQYQNNGGDIVDDHLRAKDVAGTRSFAWIRLEKEQISWKHEDAFRTTFGAIGGWLAGCAPTSAR